MKEAYQQLARLDRILKVRQIAVDEAEQRVRRCEFQMQRLQTRCDEERGKIRQTMEEFAQARGMTGLGLQRSEMAIETGRIYLARILQDIEKVGAKLEQYQDQWREARREYKTVEKLREHKLHKVSREEAVQMQKMTDDASVMRHARNTEGDFTR